MDNGSRTKPMALENIQALTASNIRAIGLRMKSMEGGKNNGLMERNMRDLTIKTRDREKEHFLIKMGIST